MDCPKVSCPWMSPWLSALEPHQRTLPRVCPPWTSQIHWGSRNGKVRSRFPTPGTPCSPSAEFAVQGTLRLLLCRHNCFLTRSWGTLRCSRWHLPRTQPRWLLPLSSSQSLRCGCWPVRASLRLAPSALLSPMGLLLGGISQDFQPRFRPIWLLCHLGQLLQLPQNLQGELLRVWLCSPSRQKHYHGESIPGEWH